MQTICKYQNIKDLLQDWMKMRKSRNPRLSLSSHAKFLKMAPSMLSQVLHGKRNISVRQASLIGELLKLQDKEKRHVQLLAEIALLDAGPVTAQDVSRRNELLSILRISALEAGRDRFAEDQFQHFSDWFSLPILVMCTQSDLWLSVEEIATRLALDLDTVQGAIERMERIGVLTWDGSAKKWIHRGKEVLLSTAGRSDALREFHKQMLNRTCAAIDRSPIGERYIGTETFRFSPKHMSKAQAMIDHCLDSLLSLEKESMKEENTALYHAGVQFFKITDFPDRARQEKAI